MPKLQQTRLDPRLEAKLFELRNFLTTARDLDEVSEYFYTALVSDDAFMVSGSPVSHSRLVAALQAVLERVAPEGKLGTPWVIRLDQQAFCHGYSSWGRGHVLFFYFEQLDLGFCSYSRSSSAVEVSHLRFSLTNAAGSGNWGAWQNACVAKA